MIHPGMVDSIEINIPDVYKPTGEQYVVPASLSLPKVKVFRQEQDWGPIMKLAPTLQRYKGQKVVILTMDDDTVYSTLRIARILEKLKAYNFEAVLTNSAFPNSFNALNMPERPAFQVLQGDELVDVIEGFSLVAYPSWLCDVDQMLAFSQKDRVCFQSDDVTISLSLAQHQVPRVFIDVNQLSPAVYALNLGL
jgi:hypothetical protein